MKLKLEEVIENVREELLCYEGAETLADRWAKEFREWMEKNKGKKKDIVVEKSGLALKIKDEEEIFEMADAYMDAVEEGSIKKYWETF